MRYIIMLALSVCVLGGCVVETNPEWDQLQAIRSKNKDEVNVDKELFLKYVNQPYGEDVISLCEHTQGSRGAFSRSRCTDILGNNSYSVNDFALAIHHSNQNIIDINYVNYCIVDYIVNFKIGDITDTEWYDKKNIEKKYGIPSCTYYRYGVIDDNCITSTEYGMGFEVKYQTPEGTVVEGRKMGGPRFLIEYNEEISKLFPGQTVHGRFVGTGKFFKHTDSARYEHEIYIIKFLGYN